MIYTKISSNSVTNDVGMYLSELDSHADITCCRKGFLLTSPSGKTCSVEPILLTYKPIKSIPIGTCITAYANLATLETYILYFHQTLYFGKELETSLLNPNQIRCAGHIVNGCPTNLFQTAHQPIQF
mmetsp:Transcript_31040/g.71022  ORF Transcript_31040/g.71022 Transcript_31040/m.71022 type:complete len:127 (-) Transcript_31040:5234-5614(-)